MYTRYYSCISLLGPHPRRNGNVEPTLGLQTIALGNLSLLLTY